MLTCNYKFEVEKSRDGYNVIKISKDSRELYIGSKYNMKSEIDKFIKMATENVNNKGNEVFIIYGFGNGDHIRTLRKAFRANKIIVFEPNINLYNYAVNLEFVRNDEALKIICCENSEFIHEFHFGISETNINQIKISYFSNYSNIYKDELQDFLDSFKFLIKTLLISKQTALLYSKLWFDTLLKNLPSIIESTPIYEYKNKYKNKPAIIVSAGPSLDKNIKELKKAKEKMLILSSTRTLSSILELDIEPDLLVAVDPGDNIYKLMEKCNKNYNGPLLYYELTNHLVVNNHKGDKIFYTSSKLINSIMNNRMPKVKDGGTVAISMTNFAILAGCNPIIFIGQDLAYSGKAMYANVSENKSIDINMKFELTDDIYVEGVNEKQVRTNTLLNIFRLNLERLILQNKNIDFINATEGGARINGTIEMTLKDAINKYGLFEIEAIGTFKKDINAYKEAIKQLKNIQLFSKNIIECCNSSLVNLKNLKSAYILKDNERVNKIINMLDEADKYIEDNYEKVELIESLLKPLVFDISYSNNKGLDNDEESEIDFIIEQSNKLYGGILDNLNYAMDAIGELILKLEKKFC